MTKRSIQALALTAAVLLSTQTSWAAHKSSAETTRLSLVGAGTQSRYKDKGANVDFGPDKYGYGGGLLLEFALSRRAGFEIGGLYEHRKIKANGLKVTTVVGSTITTSTTALTQSVDLTCLNFPVLLRFWPVRFLSLGAGVYYLKGLSAKSSMSGGGSPALSVSVGSDIGAVGSVQLRLPFIVGSLLVDGRYAYGLKANVLQTAEVLAGFMFGL